MQVELTRREADSTSSEGGDCLRARPMKQSSLELRDSYWMSAEEMERRRGGLIMMRKRSSSIKSKLDLRENERLQRRMNEINDQMAIYERRLLSLKEENEALMKKKSEDSKGADDKIRTLKKKNTDLNNCIRKLEEQLKQAQLEYSVLQNTSVTSMRKNSPVLDRLMTSPLQVKVKPGSSSSQLETTSSSSLQKDKNVQHLKMKFQQLLNHLNSMNQEHSKEFTKDATQLESIVRSSAIEKLQLEKEFALARNRSDDGGTKAKMMERKVKELEKELNDLQLCVGNKEQLEVETVQKTIAIETLEKRVEYYKSKLVNLELDLTAAKDENIHLTVNNSDLQKQLELSNNMEKEHALLEERLKNTEEELKATREKNTNLEALLANQNEIIKKSEKSRKSMEEELMDLKRELNDKEATLESIERSQKKKIDDLQKFSEEMKNKMATLEEENEFLKEENKQLLRQLEELKVSEYIMNNEAKRSDLNGNNEVPELMSFMKTPGSLDSSTDSDFTSCQESPTTESSEVHIFQALYNYDPQEYSPNEQPNEELHLTAGDFVVVYGGMDEDGFYYGESMEGQKGFIPSNFVRKLSENEKADFFKIINMDLLDPQLNNSCKVLLPPLASEPVAPKDTVIGQTSVSSQMGAMPDPPVSINVEISPNRCHLLTSWLPVTIALRGTSNGVRVAGYCVYADGRKVKVVNNPTDDQVQIQFDEIGGPPFPRYITVRTLASNGIESSDSAPFFLGYGSAPSIILETPKSGKDLANGKVTEVEGSYQSLPGDDEFDMTDKSWKNLPNRQSLDFQATQQFQALYRSASVNDAHPPAHESIKFNSDSGLLGEEKPNVTFEQATKSHDLNLYNGHSSSNHDLQQQAEQHIRGRSHRNTRSINDINACRSINDNNNAYRSITDNIYRSITDPSKDRLTSKGGYQNIILTDNEVVTSVNIRDDIPDSELIDYEDDAPESLLDDVREDGEERVRIFIALFSYDPVIMSPNPDAGDVELKFREGQIIKILGSKDEDGFFLGEVGGRRGLVPCNMVSEVEVDDPNVADELLLESNRQIMQSALGMNSATSSPHPDDNREIEMGGEYDASPQETRYMVAIYDYNALELSPNADVEQELSFKEGELIEIFGEVDSDGFFYGRINDKVGLVPSNFVTEYQGDTLM